MLCNHILTSAYSRKTLFVPTCVRFDSGIGSIPVAYNNIQIVEKEHKIRVAPEPCIFVTVKATLLVFHPKPKSQLHAKVNFVFQDKSALIALVYGVFETEVKNKRKQQYFPADVQIQVEGYAASRGFSRLRSSTT